MSMVLSSLISPQPIPGATLVRNLATLALCLYFLASAVTGWMEHRLRPAAGSQIVASEPAASDTEVRQADQAIPDFQIIVTRNIFGGEPEALAPTEPEKKEIVLEEIPLAEKLESYSLVGTIFTDSGGNYAIIKDSRKQEQQLLQVGDRLKSAKISLILRNNVIIEKDNQEQVLSIDSIARDLMHKSLKPLKGRKTGPADETAQTDRGGRADTQSVSDRR